MEAPSVLFVGFSHIFALSNAYQERVKTQQATFRASFLRLKPLERHEPFVTLTDNGWTYHPLLREDIENLIVAEKPSLIVASLWSNQHFVLCATNHPRPFDFILPEESEGEISPGSEIVPFDLVHALVDRRFGKIADAVGFFKTIVDQPIVSLSAPPPIANVDDLEKATADSPLDEKVRQWGVAPARLRYRVWKLCESMFREHSAEHGVPLIPVPEDTVDIDGFRQRAFIGADWLHGNRAYGERVLRQIDDLVAQPMGTG